MKLSKINILEALKIARSKIDSLDSELLLSFVKKVERSYLVTHEKEILTAVRISFSCVTKYDLSTFLTKDSNNSESNESIFDLAILRASNMLILDSFIL